VAQAGQTPGDSLAAAEGCLLLVQAAAFFLSAI